FFSSRRRHTRFSRDRSSDVCSSDLPTYQRFSDSYAVGVVEGDDALLTVGATAPQTTYLENYRVATGPQQGYSLGLEYRDPHYWWIGATGNYMAGNYLDPAPYRRTSEVWGSEPWN